MMIPKLRHFIKTKLAKSQGTGPSQKVMENGYHTTFMQGIGTKGTKISTVLHFENEDPGYKGTAHILAEAG